METSRTVIEHLLRGKSPIRVGIMDFFWGDTLAKWVPQGYPTRIVYKNIGEKRWFPEDGRWEKVTEPGEFIEPVPVWEHFEHDLVGVGVGFDIMPLRGCDEIVAETDEWISRRNGAGAVHRCWKHKSGTPEHIDFRMISREIWERDYRPHLLEWDQERLGNLDEARRNFKTVTERKVWTHFGNMFIWELMRQSMGDVTLYESLLLDPDWVHDYNRVYTEMYQRYFRYIFENVGLPDGIWLYEDLGYRNGLFASPVLLEKLIFPYYREMVDFFHSYDLPVVLHSCGSTAEALPLIIDAGFDALHPMERKADGNNPFLFAEKYKDKLTFIGGFDVRIFETNDRERIRREMIAYIDGMKSRGARLVFASDHSIPPTIDYDTYRFIVDVYREKMWY
jgi:uroporphyrinogen decarboxylase